MTYVGPFTQATLMYEPDEASPKGEVATPGTILDYVAKNLPHFLPIIKKAGQLPFYNATERRYTLFVRPSGSKRLPPDCCHNQIDPNTSPSLGSPNKKKMSTVPGVITTGITVKTTEEQSWTPTRSIGDHTSSRTHVQEQIMSPPRGLEFHKNHRNIMIGRPTE